MANCLAGLVFDSTNETNRRSSNETVTESEDEKLLEPVIPAEIEFHKELQLRRLSKWQNLAEIVLGKLREGALWWQRLRRMMPLCRRLRSDYGED